MRGETISAAKLAGALAEGLVAVLPAELDVFVAEAVVSLRVRGTRSGMDADLRPPPDLPAHPPALHDLSAGLQSEITVIDDAVRRETARPKTASPTRESCVRIADVPDTLESALEQSQDEVAETLTEPWPSVAPGPMPQAFAELRDDRVVAGYGDPTNPVLTVISVAVQALR